MDTISGMLPKSYDKHETKFALLLVWIIGPCILTLFGFYMGTIFGTRNHHIDLQVQDMGNGRMWAAIFFCASLVLALIATAIIPKVVDRDYALREERWARHEPDMDHG